jgi:hypothetical protein
MLIGFRDFVDGQRRPVYLDEDGNQYVINDAGREVFGEWLRPEDDSDQPIFLGGLESGDL